MLSPLQDRKISRMFDVLDVDRDGFLSPADTDRVVGHLVAQRGWTEGGPEHRALREAYGPGVQALAPFRDPAGRVTHEAYLRYHQTMLNSPGAYQATIRRLAELVFEVLDSDGDGRVSEQELRNFYAAYSIDESLSPEAFHRLDMDGDGIVSKSEILDAVGQFYLSSDPEAPGNWLLGTF